MCQTIRFVSNGFPLETEEDQARAIQLRSIPPERRRPRHRRREQLESVPEEEEQEKVEERGRPTERREAREGERKAAERPISPPSVPVMVTDDEEEEEDDHAEPEEEAVAELADDGARQAPPVMVFDRAGVPGLLPPQGQNLVPEASVKLPAGEAEVITQVIRSGDWPGVEQYREHSKATRARKDRERLEQDAATKDKKYVDMRDAFVQREAYKKTLWETPIVKSLMDAQIDEQTVALHTAMNGSRGGSSASRLVEAEQGAGEAEASHPNFLQRARAQQQSLRSDSDGSSSAASNERRRDKDSRECWTTSMLSSEKHKPS